MRNACATVRRRFAKLAFTKLSTKMSSLRGLLQVGLLLIGCSGPVILFAGEIWDGGNTVDSKWTTDANWDGPMRNGTSPPNNGTANIHFAGNDRTIPNVDVPYSINSLTFDAGSVSFSSSDRS